MVWNHTVTQRKSIKVVKLYSEMANFSMSCQKTNNVRSMGVQPLILGKRKQHLSLQNYTFVGSCTCTCNFLGGLTPWQLDLRSILPTQVPLVGPSPLLLTVALWEKFGWRKRPRLDWHLSGRLLSARLEGLLWRPQWYVCPCLFSGRAVLWHWCGDLSPEA